MSLVTGLARLLGQILSSVHMENFNLMTRMKFKKQNQNGASKTCIIHNYHSFVSSFEVKMQINCIIMSYNRWLRKKKHEEELKRAAKKKKKLKPKLKRKEQPPHNSHKIR